MNDQVNLEYFEIQETEEQLMVVQKRRNTSFPGTVWVESNWNACADELGVCVNGDFGTNPPERMMYETAIVFELLVSKWQKRRSIPGIFDFKYDER